MDSKIRKLESINGNTFFYLEPRGFSDSILLFNPTLDESRVDGG